MSHHTWATATHQSREWLDSIQDSHIPNLHLSLTLSSLSRIDRSCIHKAPPLTSSKHEGVPDIFFPTMHMLVHVHRQQTQHKWAWRGFKSSVSIKLCSWPTQQNLQRERVAAGQRGQTEAGRWLMATRRERAATRWVSYPINVKSEVHWWFTEMVFCK